MNGAPEDLQPLDPKEVDVDALFDAMDSSRETAAAVSSDVVPHEVTWARFLTRTEWTAEHASDATAPDAAKGATSQAPIVELIDGAALSEPLPPILYLCELLRLTCGSPTIFAGNSFAGKSLALADLALAVATGGEAWGRFPCRQGKARVVDYDGQGRRISQERFQRLARARGVDLRALGNEIGYIRKPGFYLDAADATDRLCQLLDGVALCIIDSWRGATPYTDEWRRGPVQLVGDRLEVVSTTTGCTIVIIDHHVKPPRESNGGPRRSLMHDLHGSSAKAELAQSLFPFGGEEGAQFTRVKHVKERVTGHTVPPFGLRFEDVEEQGDPRWGLRVSYVDRSVFDEPTISPEQREAQETATRHTKAATRRAENAERARQVDEEAEARRRRKEEGLRRQRADDDAAARILTSAFPDLAKRDLIAKLKTERACGFERADDALRRIAPARDESVPGVPAVPSVPGVQPSGTAGTGRPPSPGGTDGGSPLGGANSEAPPPGTEITRTSPPSGKREEQERERRELAEADADLLATIAPKERTRWALSQGWTGGRLKPARAVLSIRAERDADALMKLTKKERKVATKDWTKQRCLEASAVVDKRIAEERRAAAGRPPASPLQKGRKKKPRKRSGVARAR